MSTPQRYCDACIINSPRLCTDHQGERSAGDCTCWDYPNPWTYYGTAEPGSLLEPDPDCPEHFPGANA